MDRMRTASREIRPAVAAVLMAVVLAGCAGRGVTPAAAPDAPAVAAGRDAVTLHMIQLVRSGRVAEARASVREYTAVHPGDGTMLYNLACLDLMAADRETALANLESALGAGYTNFRLMEKDRSLSALRDDPRYLDLVERYESALHDTLESRALFLEAGYEQSGVPLHAADPVAGLRAALTVGYDRDALTLAVDARDPGFTADARPWQGGAGLVVELVRPIGHDDYESRSFHAVAVGLDQGEPRAWLVSVDGEPCETPLADVPVELTRRGADVRWQVTLPWSIFRPYGPPLDLEMGLNVVYVGAGTGSSRPTVALMPEARLPWEGDPWRRYVPVQFLDSDRSRPSASGRLSNRLVEGPVVALEAGAWCASGGEGHWTLEVLAGNHAAQPAQPRLWPCTEGPNFFDTTLDVEALPTGLYRLRARCTLPDGVELILDEPFYSLREADVDDLNRRLYELDSPRAQLVRYQLFVFAHDLDRRHPLAPVEPLDAEFRRIRGLVEDLEAGRPVLPDSGPFLGGFNVDTMIQRSCALHLPSGWREAVEPHLLIIVPPAPGEEQALAKAVGERREDLIVLVPQSHGATGLDLDRATRHTVAALAWARELFGAGRITLAGLGGGADAALAVAALRPDLVSELLLETDDLGEAGAAGLAELLEAADALPPMLLVASRAGEAHLNDVADVVRSHGGRVLGGTLDPGAPVTAWLADVAPR